MSEENCIYNVTVSTGHKELKPVEYRIETERKFWRTRYYVVSPYCRMGPYNKSESEEILETLRGFDI